MRIDKYEDNFKDELKLMRRKLFDDTSPVKQIPESVNFIAKTIINTYFNSADPLFKFNCITEFSVKMQSKYWFGVHTPELARRLF